LTTTWNREVAVYTFITDETNVQASKDGDFFIYGGLIFSADQMTRVTSDIELIRAKRGFEPGDKLKFDTNSRPKEMPPATYTAAKNDVVRSCLDAGVKFIAYMILHKIVDKRFKGEFALNSVLVAFGNKFLVEKRDYGIVVMDRLPESTQAYDMLKRKFQEGLRIASTGGTIAVPRVLLYATTCDGASHLSSAVDIVLGSLRWVVNNRKNPKQSPAAQTLLNNVANMMYHRKIGDNIRVRERVLILRPQNIAHPPYKQEYEDLVAYLASLV
jgi:hypothetical protein